MRVYFGSIDHPSTKPPGAPDYGSLTAVNAAKRMADVAEYAAMTASRAGIDSKGTCSVWVQNFGDGVFTPALTGHASDAAMGRAAIWRAGGVAALNAHALGIPALAAALADELAARGLAPIDRVFEDVESWPFDNPAGIDGNPHATNSGWMAAVLDADGIEIDPRWSDSGAPVFVSTAGPESLESALSYFGDPRPTWGQTWFAAANHDFSRAMSIIHVMALDYAMDQAVYGPWRAVFPGALCCNYELAAAHRPPDPLNPFLSTAGPDWPVEFTPKADALCCHLYGPRGMDSGLAYPSRWTPGASNPYGQTESAVWIAWNAARVDAVVARAAAMGKRAAFWLRCPQPTAGFASAGTAGSKYYVGDEQMTRTIVEYALDAGAAAGVIVDFILWMDTADEEISEAPTLRLLDHVADERGSIWATLAMSDGQLPAAPGGITDIVVRRRGIGSMASAAFNLLDAPFTYMAGDAESSLHVSGEDSSEARRGGTPYNDWIAQANVEVID